VVEAPRMRWGRGAHAVVVPTTYDRALARREREILEHAVRTVAEQVAFEPCLRSFRPPELSGLQAVCSAGL
jgi:hypothetical protein